MYEKGTCVGIAADHRIFGTVYWVWYLDGRVLQYAGHRRIVTALVVAFFMNRKVNFGENLKWLHVAWLTRTL